MDNIQYRLAHKKDTKSHEDPKLGVLFTTHSPFVIGQYIHYATLQKNSLTNSVENQALK